MRFCAMETKQCPQLQLLIHISNIISDTLSLFEREFISSDGHNFVKDFSECKMTEVFARAYFRAFNLYDSWLFLRLTIEDMDLLVDEIDSSTGNFGNRGYTLGLWKVV